MNWAIDSERRVVLVSGRGIVNRAFIDQYLLAMNAMGTKGYRKLFDLSHAAFEIERQDIHAVALGLTQFGADGRAGPVAMVVGMSPLSVDMAVLLKQNVEPTRPFRLFTRLDEAEQWLMQLPAR